MSEWQLVWSDEFDGPAGTAPNPASWTAETGNREMDGWGNHELQYYTQSPQNVRLNGAGHLEIRALEAPEDERGGLPCWNGEECRYTSARLSTRGKVEFTYGKVEARLTLPSGVGVWPAFWSLAEGQWPESGEIDIMEWIGRTPDTLYATVHGPGYSGAAGPQGKRPLNVSAPGEFHTYGLIKRPYALIWLLDGEEYHRLTPADLPVGTEWVFERPFHLLLNFAVGGDWPGPPADDLQFPKTLTVDFVRLWHEL